MSLDLEGARRRAAEMGVVRTSEPPAPLPPAPPQPEWDPSLIPDVSDYERSGDDIELDRVIDGITVLDAYRKWCGKMEPQENKRGESIMISCPNPDHPDNNPSAWVNTHKGVWSCAACGAKGGDKFDIAAWHFGYSVPGYKTDGSFPKLRYDMAADLGWTGASRSLATPPPPSLRRVQFKFQSSRELAAIANTQPSWLIRGMLIQPTYGMLAGEKKALKTYVSNFIDVAVASGEPLFDHFEVKQGPVLSFVGEGGTAPHGRRLQRIARAMGVQMDELPIHTTTDVAPIQSQEFSEALERGLTTYKPRLIHIDPYYAYHGAQSSGANLFEEGSILSSLSGPCMEYGSSLIINNHFNKTGSGRNLARITQSGGAEWSDTWIIITKLREDVANGQFTLLLDVGSRQWGGFEYELQLDIGRYDETRHEWSGDISFEITRRSSTASGPAVARQGAARERAIAWVTTSPFTMTQEELAKKLGGNLKQTRDAIRQAVAEEAITTQRDPKDGRRTLLGPGGEA